MFVNVISDRIIGTDGSGQEQGQLILSNRIAGAIFHPGLRPGIRQALKSERGFVEMRRLLGVPDIKLDVIRALQGQEIFLGYRCFFSSWSSNCRWHNDLLLS